MTTTTKNIISPSDKLVLSLEVGQVPIPILQPLFNDNLVGSELPIHKQRVKSIHTITDMFLATENLDLWVRLYMGTAIGNPMYTPEEESFIPPARLKKANSLANLIPITSRKT